MSDIKDYDTDDYRTDDSREDFYAVAMIIGTVLGWSSICITIGIWIGGGA